MMDYDLWHLFVCSLISTEMIKIMHWRVPQVGGEDQSWCYHRQAVIK